jgi:hypothetical protein
MDPIVYTLYLCFLGKDEYGSLARSFRKIMDGSGENYNWDMFVSNVGYLKDGMKWNYKASFWYEGEQAWNNFSYSKLLDFVQRYKNEEEKKED